MAQVISAVTEIANPGGFMSAQIEEAHENQEPQTDVPNDEAVAHQEAERSSAESSTSDVSGSSQSQEYNWKRARKQLEELQWENKWLREQAEKREAQKQAPAEEDDSEVDSLAMDEILTKAQTLKLSKKETKKFVQESLQKFKNEILMETLDERIRSRYPDYFSVASQENVEELKSDPLFVKSYQGLTNPFDQACYIYEQLKLRGYSPEANREKQQLERNAQKPRSTQALGSASPLHMANDYSAWPSKDLQNRLYQEMVEASKGA